MLTDRNAANSDMSEGACPPADLSHAQMSAPTSTSSKATWRGRLSERFRKTEWAPDLSRNIGSKRWFRGVASIVVLSALAIAAWPGFTPVAAAPSVRIDDTIRDEFRSQMIMPLALGGDSGKRMGATFAVSELERAPERPRLDLMATLTQGDGFSRMLERAGVGREEADQVARMIASAVSLADIDPGTQVDITLGRRLAPDAPRPLDALSFRARFDLQLVVERRNGELALDPRPIMVDATPLRVRGTVGESLYRSARAVGAPPSAVQEYLRTISRELNLDADVSATDEFDMIIDYRRAATGEIEVGDLLYAAVIRDDRPRLQLMRFGREGRFYDAAGEGTLREGLIRPTSGRISSRYGMRRHPILGYRRMHAGVDFAARTGTPVYAATNGTVNFAGRNGGYGNHVRIRHAGGLGTSYSHLSRIAVRNGQSVERGQVIGYVGSTGLSTGPHLHYEMTRNGQKIDPLSVQFVTRSQLSRAEMANFRERLLRLQMVEPGEALASLAPEQSAPDEPRREIDRIENRQQVD